MTEQPLPPPPPSRPLGALAPWLGDAIARFLRVEAVSGIVLLGAAACALAWANSPWSAEYHALWRLPLTLAASGDLAARTLRFWINEGLMTVFFLVIGLEIRRELHQGALSSWRLAALPVVAALGGMIAPALIFLALAHGPALRRGWAIPTATDIAFAVGVLALLGTRVPRALRTLLLALAVIDDIGAVLIIAFFYSSGIAPAGLIVAAAAVAAVLVLARLGSQWALVYAAAGILIWLGLLRAGVHPTLAGVILGLLVPVTDGTPPQRVSPSMRLGETLHPWVAYGIMPLFALANAGIDFHGLARQDSGQARLAAGVAAALLLGKPLGVVLATLGSVRLRLCSLPHGVTPWGLLLVGCLAGIGFTMSIFISGLAFPDESRLLAAKLGILAGSACAAILGTWVGWLVLRKR